MILIKLIITLNYLKLWYHFKQDRTPSKKSFSISADKTNGAFPILSLINSRTILSTAPVLSFHFNLFQYNNIPQWQCKVLLRDKSWSWVSCFWNYCSGCCFVTSFCFVCRTCWILFWRSFGESIEWRRRCLAALWISYGDIYRCCILKIQPFYESIQIRKIPK